MLTSYGVCIDLALESAFAKRIMPAITVVKRGSYELNIKQSINLRSI